MGSTIKDGPGGFLPGWQPWAHADAPEPQSYFALRGRYSRRVSNCSLILGLLLPIFHYGCANALDPTKTITQYAHSSWRVQDGTFDGTLQSVAQTTDGYIWIGTSAGILRFDGVTFDRFAAPNGEQMASNSVFALLPGRDGSMWIGTEAGLYHWADRHLVGFPKVHGTVTSIIEDHAGVIWASQRSIDNSGGLCQLSQESVQCYGREDGIPIDTGCCDGLVEDARGNLWIGASTMLLRWRPTLKKFAIDGLQPIQSGVLGLAPSRDNVLWVGMNQPGNGLGLQKFDHEMLSAVSTPNFNSSSLTVVTLFIDRDESLWIGTIDNGVYRIHGTQVDHFDSHDGLSGDFVWKFYEDREGTLWIATAKGLDSFRESVVTSFTPREGLSSSLVGSVLARRDGSVWVGGASGALGVVRKDGISNISRGQGLPGTQITSMLEDHVGRLWVGIDSDLWIYSAKKFQRISRPDGSATGMVAGITEDINGDVWIETIQPPRTLLHIHNMSVQEMFPVPRLPGARKVAADPHGGIWLGFISGDIGIFRNGVLRTIDVGKHPSKPVAQIVVDDSGSILAATAFGLIRWHNEKAKILNSLNGLPCDATHAVVADDNHNLWLYMECALVEITQSELQKWWAGSQELVKTRNFGVLDGARPRRSDFNSATKSSDGRLWFANSNELQMIDPAHLEVTALVPPLNIERLTADRKVYAVQDGIKLPAQTRDLQIDYTALSFVIPQRIRFRYKLQGYDGAWREAGTRRQAFYTNLGPGNYQFRVLACNSDGVWNEEGASVSFSIAPAWYQTAWFLVLCLLAAALVVFSVYRIRTRQIARALSMRFDERLAERTRLARDLHDTLLQTIQGSKMVADNALADMENADRMRNTLRRLSTWLEQAVQEGRAALDSLRAAVTSASELAEAIERAVEPLQQYRTIRVSVSVSGVVRPMQIVARDEVFQIANEAIRNAHQHSYGDKIEVTLSYDKKFVMVVSDNGRGIDSDVERNGKPGHFGLLGMRERAQRIGGTIKTTSSPESGTQVKLSVAGSNVFETEGDSFSGIFGCILSWLNGIKK